MSEYMDEKIIDLQRYKEKQKHSILERGVFIGEEYYEFHTVTLYDDLLSIVLPESFVDMPPNIAKLKYPSETRPQIIKTSLDTKVNFMFNLYGMPLENDQVREAAAEFRNVLKRVNPSTQFFAFEEIPLSKKTLAWFDFKSNAIDSQLYNIIYCASIDGKVFQGFFNCLFPDGNDWQPVVLEILSSIRDLKEEGETI